MKKIKITLSIILLLVGIKGFGQKTKVVVGEAVNFKAGAAVVIKNEKRAYFLDGISFWEENIVGKIVKVKGRLKLEDIKKLPHKPGFPIPQQMVGIKRTILKPKWILMK
jgi:hypothetical protein